MDSTRDRRKRWAPNWLLGVVLTGLLALGCEPDEQAPLPSRSTPPAPTARSVDAGAGGLAEEICYRIVRGQFHEAGMLLAAPDTPSNGVLAPFREMVEAHDAIAARREQFRRETLAEQMEELQTFRQEIGVEGPVDVNDIGDVLSVVIKAKEEAAPDRKEDILADPFVQKVIQTAIEQGRRLENEGRWVDAYARCYYWLTTLEEDNPEYKERADLLTEKAVVEMALKDDSCGDKSVERHEGIRESMFQRALDALDWQYVHPVEFGAMATKALKRCRVVSEVLRDSQDELAFTVADPTQHDKWLTGIGTFQQDLADDGSLSKNKLLLLFDEVLALNDVTLRLPREVVIAQFSEAALSALDPFTMIVWPWNVRDFEKNMRQQFFGIGVEISKATGILKVTSLLPGTPAYTSGLDADDEIVAVDGEPTDKMSIFCAVSKITGPKDTTVTLTVRHAGSTETEDITITRGKIVVPPIRGWQRADDGGWRYLVDEEARLGYIRVTAFTENTVPDVDGILKEMEAQGLEGLILDLRFNSGGYLVSASGLVDLFVEQGTIVTSRPRAGRGFPSEERATRQGTHPNYPLVVLINGQSASASEIVAGALQDPKYERATLVGSRTYGKGSVQVVVPYTGNESQLKYTMAYYHLPSGQPVKNRYILEREGRKDWGIAPDVEVELRLSELRKMIDIQRDNEVLAKADHDNDAQPVIRHSIEETLEADPQLAIGLLVLRAKVLQQSLQSAPIATGL